MKKAKEKKKCNGLTDKRIQCRVVMDEDTTYCKKHEHFKDFTDTEINKIKTDKNVNISICIRCTNWRRNSQFVDEIGTKKEHCDICRKKNAIYREKQRIKNADKKASLKCEWKQRTGIRCRTNKINGTSYCNNHSYVLKYTDFMKEKSVLCHGCNRFVFLGNNRQCDVCKARKK